MWLSEHKAGSESDDISGTISRSLVVDKTVLWYLHTDFVRNVNKAKGCPVTLK